MPSKPRKSLTIIKAMAEDYLKEKGLTHSERFAFSNILAQASAELRRPPIRSRTVRDILRIAIPEELR